MESELDEIKNEFKNICSKYTFPKDHIYREKLIQINNLKNKKRHVSVDSKEIDDRNLSTYIQKNTHTYDFDLVYPQNYKIK